MLRKSAQVISMSGTLEPPESEMAFDQDAPTGVHQASTSRGIARNTLINLAGAFLPVVISLVTVPAYIHKIGEARYGVLAIGWVVLGYFGVFDLGLSRATANQIARMRDESPASRERVFWTALCINAMLGTLGGIILLFVGDAVLGHLLRASSELRSEAIAALPWLAFAVPLTTVTFVLAGTLEGREKFMTVNSLAIASLTMYQLAPLAYAYLVGTSLTGLIMSATIGLFAGTALSFVVTMASLPVHGRPRIDRSRVGALFRYGGWITVSGLVSPLLTVFDRVVIGAVLGARSVARYTIPYLLVARVQIVSSSLSRTLFPRFSMLRTAEAAVVGRDAVSSMLAMMTPLTVIGIFLLDPFLRVWVGEDIARSSAPVGIVLLVGMWVNSLAFVPYAFLQARGRPDLTAKFHLLEIPPYVGGLVLGLHFGGLTGAAWAWTGRVTLDAVLLFWSAAVIPESGELAERRRTLGNTALVVASCLACLTVVSDTPLRVLLGSMLVATSFVYAWRTAPAGARAQVWRYVARLRAAT
jgi:O-antigen/teichoic acid export membrane protein